MICRLAAHAMATRFELALEGRGDGALRAVGEAALEELLDCERRLSRFDPGSLLSLVNRAAHGRAVELDGDTFELLEACVALHGATGGAFDPTVAPLLAAHGLHASDAPPRLAAARAAVGAEALRLDARRRSVRFLRPEMALDLGAIGKGHALALAAAVLREHGVERALLHGGTSTVVGLGPRRFRIAIAGAPWCAQVGDAALSVSAPHGRELERDDGTISHVLDPRTGEPARALALAAVLHPDPRAADAWSTALLVGASLALLPDDAAALLVDPDGAATLHRGRAARADLAFEPLSEPATQPA